MLQKKGKLLKAFAVCLCVVLTMSLMMPAFAEGETTESADVTVYKSSDNFSIANTEVSAWNNNLWYAQLYNPVDDVYTNMTGRQTARNGRSEDGNGTGDVFYGTNSSNSPNVNAWWFAPGSSTISDNKYSAVKSFAVPKTGEVSISFGSKFFAKSKEADARIVHTSSSGSTQIWPATGYYTVEIDNTIIPDAINLVVNAGDRIRFEVSRVAAEIDATSYYSKVYWDPVISYIPDTFQSSDNFSTEDEDGVWDGVWSARMYDGTNYTVMTNFGEKAGRGETGASTENGNVYYGSSLSNSPNVNGWWLTPGNNGGWTPADDTYAAVKTFTAPKSGYVTASFADGLYSTSANPCARITVTSSGSASKVWPKTGDYETLIANETNTDTITIFVNKDDEINFEVSIPEGTTSAFYTKVHWDPVINYIPYTKSVVTKVEDGKYEVKVTASGITTVSDVIVAGYSSTNELCDVKVLSSDALSDPAVLTGSVATVKVMTWTSLTELLPKTNAETIPASEFVQAE